jgi:rhodanese-related sulfurtransferase
MRIRRTLSVAALVAATLALTSCAASEPIELSADTIVIDVRTPGEFASGHLEGAVNVDVQSGMFAEEIGAYDRDAEYVVYCRSGNRSAQAVAQMESLGFTDVTDAGSVSSASDATGIPVVTD